MTRVFNAPFALVLSFAFVVDGQAPTEDVPGSPCGYESIQGKEFAFATTFEGGEKYGYPEWRKTPGGPGLPYAPYVGRKGKLTGERVAGIDVPSVLFEEAILEDCETVLYLPRSDNPFYEGVYEGAYLTDDLAMARALVGGAIWINKAISSVAPVPDRLLTVDPKEADWRYGVYHLEKVTVTDVVLATYGHARCKGDFSLKVRKTSGVEGLLCFNRNYFFDRDPIPPGTSELLVDAIKKRTLRTGMTGEMVLLCLGKPRSVTRSAEVADAEETWEYRDKRLIFRNGRLTGGVAIR